jgi:hypothetical protein
MVAFAKPRRSYVEYLDSPAERPRFNLLEPPPTHSSSVNDEQKPLPGGGIPQRRRQEQKPPKPHRG